MAARGALTSAALLSAAAAAAPPQQLCGLVGVESRSSSQQLFAAIRADGTLGSRVLLPNETMSGLLAGNASASPPEYLFSPPFAAQASYGLFAVDAAKRTMRRYPLKAPAGGYAGAYEVASLSASEVPGDAVALLTEDYKAWVAVAELTPADGAPRVRRNLTSATFSSFEPAFGSGLYDATTRTLWTLASAGDVTGFFAVPLDGAGDDVFRNASLPPDFAILGATYCAGAGVRSVVAVGLVKEPTTYGLMALSAASLKWRLVHSWSSEALYMSGLGEIVCDAAGETAYAVLSNATGFHVVLGVDVAAGKETSRVTMADESYFVSSIAFCPAGF